MASSVTRLHIRTQTHHTRQDFLRGVISPTQRPLPDNTQHSQQTDIHASGAKRTHNPSKRAAADPRLRPRGCWDRPNDCNERNFGEKKYSWTQVWNYTEYCLGQQDLRTFKRLCVCVCVCVCVRVRTKTCHLYAVSEAVKGDNGKKESQKYYMSQKTARPYGKTIHEASLSKAEWNWKPTG